MQNVVDRPFLKRTYVFMPQAYELRYFEHDPLKSQTTLFLTKNLKNPNHKHQFRFWFLFPISKFDFYSSYLKKPMGMAFYLGWNPPQKVFGYNCRNDLKSRDISFKKFLARIQKSNLDKVVTKWP